MFERGRPNFFETIHILVLVLVVIAFFQVLDLDKYQNNTISFNGEAKEYVEADIAEFSFTFGGVTKDIPAEKNRINDKVEKVYDYLLSLGVEEEDIKTVGFNIVPQYDYIERSALSGSFYRDRILSGHNVSHTTEVVIRDFDNVDKALSFVTDQSPDRVGDLLFRVSEDRLEEIRNDLYARAIDKALDSAEFVSRESGIKVGDIVSINRGASFGGQFRALSSDSFLESASVSSIPIFSGQEEVVESVTILFEVR